MEIDIRRYFIRLLPSSEIGKGEDERDVAYVEEVLGLLKDGDTCVCRRRDVTNLSSLAYIEIVPKEDEDVG